MAEYRPEFEPYLRQVWERLPSFPEIQEADAAMVAQATVECPTRFGRVAHLRRAIAKAVTPLRISIATVLLAVLLVLSFGHSCAKSKPTYEYMTLDKTNEPRIETTDGRNAVIKEMGDKGWELTDPKMAGRTSWMIFRREKK